MKSGQRIDANQEFIGQGLSNIAAAFTSGYVSSGSLNRIWVNYEAGARTPLAAVFSALFLLAIVLVAASLAAFLPLAAMAALLFIVAWGLIDIAEMRKIVRTSHGEALVLLVTFVATLALQLELAIFAGVLASLLVYLSRTTRPRVTLVAPDPTSPSLRLVALDELGSLAASERFPLTILRIDGSLFFGAVDHVNEAIDAARSRSPYLLLVGTGMNFIDVAGAHLLVDQAALTREAGGTFHLCSLKPPVLQLLERGGFIDAIGRACVFATEEEALATILPRLEARPTAAQPA
jgi:SulP family sulfate permease